MLEISIAILASILLIISVLSLLYKRKKHAITGWKWLLTPLCFYLMATVNFLAIWMKNPPGLLIWVLTVALLVAAIYFSRYNARTN